MPTGSDEVAWIVGSAVDLRGYVVSCVSPIRAPRQPKLAFVQVTFDDRGAELRPGGTISTCAGARPMVMLLTLSQQMSATWARVFGHLRLQRLDLPNRKLCPRQTQS